MTAPRPMRYYLWRASFACFLFILLWTAWQSFIGWEDVRELGVVARFGGILYWLFAMLQLTLMLFFAPLFTAAAVSYEKDRRTFTLLLMTDLSDLEIVLGKLVAGLLNILTILGASVGFLSICAFFGGISFGQVANLFAVTAASGVAGGALGLLIALWRDRTFQSISLTILMVVFSVAGVEAFAIAFPTLEFLGVPLVEVLNPYRAMVAVLYPQADQLTGVVRASSVVYIGAGSPSRRRWWLLGPGSCGSGTPGPTSRASCVRKGRSRSSRRSFEIERGGSRRAGWCGFGGNRGWRVGRGSPSPIVPSRFQSRRRRPGEETVPTRSGADHRAARSSADPSPDRRRRARPYRHPWTNPILWRELMTRAYGAKPLIIKGCYVLLFALGMGLFFNLGQELENPLRSTLGLIPIGLTILSLDPDQCPGSHRSHQRARHGSARLAAVSELTPKEFIYGKLYGVLYNSKEMIALPVLTAIAMFVLGIFSGENLVLFLIDFLLLCHFSAMLGLHSAITYTSSRTAVANSLATIFFLMVGILLCAFLIVLNNQEFARQLLSFMIFIGAGSVALFGSLGAKNPSNAIALVAILTPFWTFYCIISLVNGDIMAAFLVSAGVYGFAILAMLVPAVGDFDIALGRTNAIQG